MWTTYSSPWCFYLSTEEKGTFLEVTEKGCVSSGSSYHSKDGTAHWTMQKSWTLCLEFRIFYNFYDISLHSGRSIGRAHYDGLFGRDKLTRLYFLIHPSYFYDSAICNLFDILHVYTTLSLINHALMQLICISSLVLMQEVVYYSSAAKSVEVNRVDACIKQP